MKTSVSRLGVHLGSDYRTSSSIWYVLWRLLLFLPCLWYIMRDRRSGIPWVVIILMSVLFVLSSLEGKKKKIARSHSFTKESIIMLYTLIW